MSEARLIPPAGCPGRARPNSRPSWQRTAAPCASRRTNGSGHSAPPLGTSRPGRRSNTELWRLAQEVLRLGVSVVLDFGLWARIERDEMRSRRSRPWCRRRTALSRRAYRRTLAAHRGPELGATLGQLPDPPKGPRWVDTRIPGARSCRAGPVRPPANLILNRCQISSPDRPTCGCAALSGSTPWTSHNRPRNRWVLRNTKLWLLASTSPHRRLTTLTAPPTRREAMDRFVDLPSPEIDDPNILPTMVKPDSAQVTKIRFTDAAGAQWERSWGKKLRRLRATS